MKPPFIYFKKIALKALRQPRQRFWPKILTSYFFCSNLYLNFLRSCYENISKFVCVVSEKIGKWTWQFGYCSSPQPVPVYNFRETESTFSVPFLKLRGRLLIAPWHGFHLFDKEMKIRLIPLQEGLLLDLLIFLLLQSVCCSKYSAKTTDFSVLNVFLHFLHQFSRTHFGIFVTVMRSKCHFLQAKVFHEGNFEDKFLSCGLSPPWFNMLEINSISIIIYLFSWNDMYSLKLWR